MPPDKHKHQNYNNPEVKVELIDKSKSLAAVAARRGSGDASAPISYYGNAFCRYAGAWSRRDCRDCYPLSCSGTQRKVLCSLHIQEFKKSQDLF